MSDKPVVLVTRRVPSKVEARVAADFDARLNRADRLYSTEELLNRAEGADAILCCHTEHFSAEVIGRLPASVKAIANISVGVDHCDLAAARDRQVVVTNTPGIACNSRLR